VNSYHFFLLFFIVFGLYFLSLYLSTTKKISLIVHRHIWNTILLVSFMVSGILGLVLALFIDLKLSILWYQTLLWLHVELGIVMALVSIFHIIWHLPYFRSYFSQKR